MAELTKQALQVENNTSFPNNNAGLITPTALRSFNSDMIDSLVDEISYTADSASFNSRINSVTGSSAITASSLITASFDNGTRNLTFTKGNNTTFAVNIPDVSGSSGNFATTGSNTFTGVQNFNAAITASNTLINGDLTVFPNTSVQLKGNTDIQNFLYVGQGLTLNTGAPIVWLGGTGSINSNINVSGSILPSVDGQGDLGNDSKKWNSVTVNGTIKGSSVNATGRNSFGTARFSDESFPLSFLDAREIVGDGSGADTHMYYGTGSAVNALREFVYTASGSNADFTAVSASLDSRINAITGSGTINTGSFATTGSNTFVGNQTITSTGNTQINIESTGGPGSQQTNLDFRGNNSNFNAYGDFNIINNGQFGGSGSVKIIVTKNNLSIATDDGVKIGATNGGGNGIDNGNISMQVRSGSLSIAPSGFTNTTASLTHISSSSNTNNINLMFKNSNTAADTTISGSGNIFTNPAAPTAGFKRYMTGGNIAVGGNGVAVPQISGSMAWSPIIANNVFAVSSTPITFRGPVSSSASTINNNLFAAGTLNLGQSAANNFERQTNGVTMNGNILGGNLNMVAAKTPLSASSTVGNNVIVGSMTLNMDSSSVNANGNMINGGATVNNSYLPGTINSTSGFVGFNTNTVNGGLTAYFSGSNTTFTGTPRTISNVLNAGGGNVISASFNGDISSVNSLGLIGQGLLAYGNQTRAAAATDATWGGAFVGRWNAVNGNRAYTADTVFAVGTGTAEATRKTAFLIDSGSNTFVEGTLNVSGSTTITGSLILSSSAATELFVIGDSQFTGSLSIQSGSAFFANGNRQFNVGAFQSNVSQSGSANVSQSMNFETTDISSGVSIVSNSRITLANAGTYNIQFSAQTTATGGADNLYIWLKKNGTNVTASAGNVEISNNAEVIAAWNYVVDAAAGDYFELAWQAGNTGTILLAANASGNIPSIPSIILTVTQVR